MKHRLPFAALAALVASSALAAVSPQLPLPGGAIPQFVDPLPSIPIVTEASLQVNMCEIQASVLPTGTLAPGVAPATWTWGYVAGGSCPAPGTVQPTYLGPIVVAQRGVPTTMTAVNRLPTGATTSVLAYRYGTDQTLHWADPLGLMCPMMLGHGALAPKVNEPCAQNYAGPIPAVVHLHGGEVPADVDGGPDQWFTSTGGIQGPGYYTAPPVTTLPANAPAGTAVYYQGPADPLTGVVPAPAWVESDGGGGWPTLANGAATYVYPNTQQAGPLWFHDHTLGATRLNVYAGLAGGYVLTDPGLALPNLPPITPLVVQDRMFDVNGQLLFPASAAGGALNPQHPYWIPEFVGDVITVNGKAWPFLNVEPKRYHFLVLNGSNARAYELFLTNPVTKVNGPAMWVVANDGGYLDTPQKLDPNLKPFTKLVVLPGERYQVVVDFAGLAPGTTLVMKNTARTPYPGGATPNGTTDGRVMQFRVVASTGADTTWDPAAPGARIRSAAQSIARLADPATGALAVPITGKKRQLTLNEVMAMPMTAPDPATGATFAWPGGPLEVLVNNTKWMANVTETPAEGTTELWEILNLTADAHPIHLHLVQFQLLNRQNFDVAGYGVPYGAAFPALPGCTAGLYCPAAGPPLPYETPNLAGAVGGNPDPTPFLKGAIRLPAPQEIGWKDTVLVPPGMVTRFVVRWTPTEADATAFPFDPSTSTYVWHCHIIDHEDNEMMRPSWVSPLAGAARTWVKGVNY